MSDPLLKRLIESRENSGQDLGSAVTLSVAGVLVSGTMIRRAAYLSALASQFTAASKLAPGQEVEMHLDVFAEIEESSGEASDYVHLMDVVVQSGNFGIDLPLWRVPLASVDGFQYGARLVGGDV